MEYQCSNCDYSSVKWLGRCPRCGEWDSFIEVGKNDKEEDGVSKPTPKPLSEIEADTRERRATRIDELDRVLGGGLVAGSVCLFGGEPGTGKSTLLLQTAANLAESGNILYISGEESIEQVKIRSTRLGLNHSQLFVFNGRHIDQALDHVNDIDPLCIIVDSVQSLAKTGSSAALGTTKQIQQVTGKCVRVAKKEHISLLLIGHITKSGEFAGPKSIEHLVDSTFYLETTTNPEIRILRPQKNRFGSTKELGLFQMTDEGLEEIGNPSEFFATQHPSDEISRNGCCVVCTLEGNRPILAEIQALVGPASGNSRPQRKVTGLDPNRVSLLLAVLEKQLQLDIGRYDIYLNVVGGFHLQDPAVDLGVVGSILSSYADTPIDPSSILIGEVGLNGEVRPIPRISSRVQEGHKLGYKKAYIPSEAGETIDSLRTFGLTDVADLVDSLDMSL